MRNSKFHNIKHKRLLVFINILLFLIGITFLITAAILYFYGKSKLNQEIATQMVIKNDSSFEKIPVEVYRKYYFYEILNSDDLVSGRSKKARVLEHGPYVYEKLSQKRNIIFAKDVSNLTFTPVDYFYFRSDLSNGSEYDSFSFLNIPLIAAADKIDSGELGINSLFLSILNLQLNENTRVFLNLTVRDLLYGYSDFLIQTIDQYSPGSLKDGKFSLLSGRNGTEFQNLTILTGKDDISKVGSIVAWNNLRNLTFWDSDTANIIKGTDGSLNGPFKTRDDSLYIFNPDICRSVTLNFKKESEKFGLKVLDFVPPENLFYNTSENQGFYKENFIGNGVFNTKKCSGFPIYLSQPHFLNADKSFINSLVGLSSPNEELHNTIIKIYPLLGAAIYANVRIQLNFKLQKSSKIE